MKRVKTKHQKPRRTPEEKQIIYNAIKSANYLNLAVMVRSLVLVYEWDKEKLKDFLVSYAVLLEEVSDGRTNVIDFVKDTKEMTGTDVKKLLDEALEVK